MNTVFFYNDKNINNFRKKKCRNCFLKCLTQFFPEQSVILGSVRGCIKIAKGYVFYDKA